MDALEFKLNQVLAGRKARRSGRPAPGGRRGAGRDRPGPEAARTGRANQDAVDGQPDRPALGLKEETVWARLNELRESRRRRRRAAHGATPRSRGSPAARGRGAAAPGGAAGRAGPGAGAPRRTSGRRIEHPGLRQLLEGLYALQDEGEPPTLDLLRGRIDSAAWPRRPWNCRTWPAQPGPAEAWLRQLLEHFRERRSARVKQELQNQLHAANDHAAALELLRQLQNRNVDLGPWARPPVRRHSGPERRGGFDGEDRRRPEGFARNGQGKGLPDLRPGQRSPARRRRQSREDRPAPHPARRSGHRADRRDRSRGARGRHAGRCSTTTSGPSSTSASSTRKTAAASTTRCACT